MVVLTVRIAFSLWSIGQWINITFSYSEFQPLGCLYVSLYFDQARSSMLLMVVQFPIDSTGALSQRSALMTSLLQEPTEVALEALVCDWFLHIL